MRNEHGFFLSFSHRSTTAAADLDLLTHALTHSTTPLTKKTQQTTKTKKTQPAHVQLARRALLQGLRRLVPEEGHGARGGKGKTNFFRVFFESFFFLSRQEFSLTIFLIIFFGFLFLSANKFALTKNETKKTKKTSKNSASPSAAKST